MTSPSLPHPTPENIRIVLDSLKGLDEADLRLPESVIRFRHATKIIAEHVREEHDIKDPSRPYLTLTHYTTLDALFAMLKDPGNARLRLYDTVHLNDPREGVATAEGKAIASGLARKLQHSSSYATSIDQDHIFSRFSTAYLLSFVASTSASDDPGDNLIFWRLYGHDGRGCSISFLPFLTPWPDSVRNALRHVCYDTTGASDYSREILNLLELYGRLDQLPILEHPAQHELSQTLPLLEECLTKRFLMKDPPYEPEHEVRLVRFARPTDQSSPREPCVELARGVVRHYLECDDLKLQGLVDSRTVLRIGPAVPHPQDAKHALRRLWAKTSLPSIQIEASRIEYRPS